jgi:hypothetical protein
MPFVQNVYQERMNPAVAGMLHGSDNDVFTGIVGYDESDLPLELAYPRCVQIGTGSEKQPVVLVGTLTAVKFAGITIRDVALGAEQDVYTSGQNVGVLRRGSIWVVVVGGSCVPGDLAYMVPTTGIITRVSSGGNIAIPGARFITKAAQNGLAILHIDGSKPNT